MEGRDYLKVVEGFKPPAGMVLVQLVSAGINILYKLALDDGMDVGILVAYRYLFAMAFSCPLAFFLERKGRPRLTREIVMLSFFSGLFGGPSLSNLLHEQHEEDFSYLCLSNDQPNSFKLESLKIKRAGGQAKAVGILVGLSGAMLFTFYKGAEIKLGLPSIKLLNSDNPHRDSGNPVLSLVLAAGSCGCNAIWLIVQAKTVDVYPCHWSSAALTCMTSAVQAIIYAVLRQRHAKEWRIGFDIRLLCAASAGIIANGLMLPLLAWCIQKGGPLYASVFSPPMLIVVTLLSSILFSEALHLGSILGSVLIVIGLFVVLWGKGRGGGKSTRGITSASSYGIN